MLRKSTHRRRAFRALGKKMMCNSLYHALVDLVLGNGPTVKTLCLIWHRRQKRTFWIPRGIRYNANSEAETKLSGHLTVAKLLLLQSKV